MVAMKGRTQSAGFTLIEVLVSILVLAIGLLGVAAILLVSLRNAQGSMEQTSGVVQAYAIMDTMRANKPQAIIGAYDLTEYTCNSPATDNRIGREQADWLTNLRTQLGPSACGRIRCTSLNCEVSVRWNDERATGGAQEREYILSTRL